MIRFLAQTALTIIANGIGLLAAATFLDGFSIDLVSFVIAVLFFTVVTVVLGPLIFKTAVANANYLVGGIALVTILVGLLLTDWFSDGISIDGVGTFILATLIVWIFSVLASVVLPLFLFKSVISGQKEKTSTND